MNELRHETDRAVQFMAVAQCPKRKKDEELESSSSFFRRQITVCHKKLEGTAFFFQDFLKKD